MESTNEKKNLENKLRQITFFLAFGLFSISFIAVVGRDLVESELYFPIYILLVGILAGAMIVTLFVRRSITKSRISDEREENIEKLLD